MIGRANDIARTGSGEARRGFIEMELSYGFRRIRSNFIYLEQPCLFPECTKETKR